MQAPLGTVVHAYYEVVKSEEAYGVEGRSVGKAGKECGSGGQRGHDEGRARQEVDCDDVT